VVNLPYDDDEAKVNFIHDKNFKFYSKQASLFGFNIDKNIPWRLTANLSSGEMQAAAATRRKTPVEDMGPETGVNKILMENYILAHLNEYDSLMLELASGFVRFSRQNRKMYRFEEDCNGRLVKNVVSNRAQPKRGYVFDKPEEFYLTYYFKIRLLEAGVDIIKPGQHNSFIKRVRELYKLLDKSKALGYINQKTKLLQSRSGL
jgi:hypothetical protein